MIAYAILDETGVVIGRGLCVSIDDLVSSALPGGSATDIGDGENPQPLKHYLGADGEFHPLPDRPSAWAKWSGETWIDQRSAAEIAAHAQAAADAAWAALRSERDRHLLASDWTEMPSALARLSADQLTAWQEYRTALRDLPETTADPASPVWPIKPE